METENLTTPTGSKFQCNGLLRETGLWMLHNNLDTEVAKKPDELTV